MSINTILPHEYVGLHTHSDASLLDGHSTVKDLVTRAKELGQTAVTVTDHGNLHNSYALYSEALRQGVKPLVGIEAYVAPSPISHKDHGPYFFADGGPDDVSSKGSYTHLLLFAKNNEGLKSLYKLSELSYSEGYWRKPRMSVELFREHAKGNLIATTGCPSGELQTLLRLGLYDEAVQYAAMMQDIFGAENYFMELMDHDMTIDLERKVLDQLLQIADRLSIPLLATADSHYTYKEDAHAHEHMLCISTRSKMNVPTSLAEGEGGKTRFAFNGNGYYVHSAEEMIRKFPEDRFPGAVRNSAKIAEMCNITINPRDDLRPQIDLPDGETEASFLKKEAFKGLARRLPEKASDPEYIERMEIELGVIVPKNYSGYFLVVSDFLRWAKRNDIPCGPGRGSAAGSLLAYALDITDADPIRHGLLFERFLNPERESPPDIDIDLNDTDREKVIEYVKQKYGMDRVAQVVTFGKILAKNAVKDTVRILDEPYSLGEELSKAMPDPVFGKTMSLKDIYTPGSPRYDEAADFRALVEERNAGQVVDIARQLEGRIRSTGVHAAAVVVSSKPVVENIPMFVRQADGAYITQWDYPTAEHLGLLKFDFLGLRNLGIIRDAVKHIERRRGIKLNPTEIIEGTLDDPKVYKLLADGNTQGVFQLDGGGMRALLKLMKPTEFEDISAALSLYRPGPMGVNAHTDYALRKNGLQKVSYIHPELTNILTPILGPTFGLCVAGDTLVWNANTGTQVRIDSIEDEVNRGEFYTWSVNAEGLLEKKNVSHWFFTGEKEIYTIKSKNGREVRVSGEHPVLTLDGYKPASDLTTSDYVASSKEAFVEVEQSALSKEEASLLGYLTGDGYLTYYQNSFTNSSREVLDKVAGLASGLFDDVHITEVPRFRDEKQYTTHMYFSANASGIGKGNGKKKVYGTTFQLNNWLKALFNEDTLRSDTKYVPDAVFQSSHDAMRTYLAGLWDTDGHVSSNFSYLRTISKNLAYGVQSLLSRLGIRTQIIESEKYSSQKGERTSYGVYVYDEIFWSDIVPLLVTPAKNKAFDRKTSRHSQVNSSNRISIATMKQDLFEAIMNDPKTSKNVKENTVSYEDLSLKTISKFLSRASDVPLSIIQEWGTSGSLHAGHPLVQVYLEKFASAANLMNSNLSWSPITEITVSAAEKVYDITVEDNHNFLGNGIVLHNCIYQEQVQLVAREMAGYSLGAADNLRRAMGKKKKEVLDAEFIPFQAGSKANGYSDEAIKAIWDVLVPFADYAFNKSHTVAYGLTSYMTAFLKANYPVEFYAALLSSVSDDADKTATYLEDARMNGIQVLPPDVSRSEVDYIPISDSQVTFGLKAIRGIGSNVGDDIVATRQEKGEFKDINSFMTRVPPGVVNKRVLEGLTYGGAFDGFGLSRRALIYQIPELVKTFQKVNRKKNSTQMSLFDLEDAVEYMVYPMDEYGRMEKLSLERTALGLYVSGHPIDGLNIGNMATVKIVDLVTEVHPAFEGWPPRGAIPYRIAGVLTALAVKRTRKGESFAICKLEDRTGSIECAIFPKSFKEIGDLLKIDGVYQFVGFTRKRDEEISFTVDGVRPLEFGESGNLSVRLKVTDTQWELAEKGIYERLHRHRPALNEPGDEVIVSFKNRDGEVWEKTLDVKVKRSPALVQEIQELLGALCIGRWRPAKSGSGATAQMKEPSLDDIPDNSPDKGKLNSGLF